MDLQTDDFEQPPRISRAFARFGKSGKGCEAGRVAFERPQNVFGSTSNSLTRKSFSKKTSIQMITLSARFRLLQ
jgi:hypothetical protein